MAIDLIELRYKIDQITEKVVSGLKDRSRYKHNPGVFTQEFFGGKTWFEYRLLREQSLDSEFGRYEFPDQHPLIFKKTDLAQPKKKREQIQSDIKPIILNQNPGQKMAELYKKSLVELCEPGDNESQYGETAKCDVSNVILYNERITGIGTYVAEAKLQKDPTLPFLTTEEIRKKIVDPIRELQVIEKATQIAEKYGLNKQEYITKFFQHLMRQTVNAEIMYIQQQKPKQN